MNTKRTHVRILSLLLCLSMILGMAPMIRLFPEAAATDPGQETAQGSCTADHSEFTELGTANAAQPVAVEASQLAAGGNFKLISDIQLSGMVNVASTEAEIDLHIDLNGFTVTCPTSATMFYIGVGAGKAASLTLCDSVGTGKLDASAVTGSSGKGIVSLSANGTFNLYGGTITGHTTTSDGGGIYINSGTATVNMKGGAVTGNTAARGAGIFRQAGALNLEGGVISNNTATGNAGGIWINSGTFTMKGGKISGNKAANYAGIYGAGATTTNIEGGEISGNVATAQGGGIGIGGNRATLNIKGGTISNNQAKNGGAFAVASGTSVLNISGGKISGNTTTNVTGANGSVLLSNACTLNISGGEITGNKSYAKTITVSGGVINISGGKISGNTNLDGSAVAQVHVNNYVSASTATFSGSAVVEDPIVVEPENTTKNYPAASAKVENLVLGASILVATASKDRVTVDAADESVIETKTDAGYVYTGNVNWVQISGTVDALAEGFYKLTGATSLSAALTVSGEVTIDLNGQTLTGEALPYFTVPAGAKLTIKDSATGGKIQGWAAAKGATEVMIMVSGGDLILDSGELTGHNRTNAAHGSVLQVSGGSFTMNGGAITNNVCKRWGTVYISGGKFVMNGGEFYGNSAQYGGALAANGANVEVEINGGKIGKEGAPNKAEDYKGDGRYGGAAIYSNEPKSFVINGGEICYNETAANGGGLFYNGSVTMNGGLIAYNKASAGSAAISSGGTFVMTGGEIRNNVNQSTTYKHLHVKNYDLSGAAVIDEGAVGQISGGTLNIHDLKDGASIYANYAATSKDDTVKEEKVGSLYLYTDAYQADTRWDFFEDDFEDYTAGENAFKDQLDSNYYTGVQYTAGRESYDIVQDGENQYLKLAVTNDASSKNKNYFLYSHGISGAYTMEFDFRIENAGAGWVLNMLQGYTFPNGSPILAYINTVGGAYICDQATAGGTGTSYYVEDANGDKLIPQIGTWYSLKMTLEKGKMTLKVWEKGTTEPVEGAGVAVCEAAIISDAALAASHSVRFQTRNAYSATHTVCMDNLKLSKMFGAENPGTVIADVGDKVEVVPNYTVNSLAQLKPYAKYQYTFTDTTLVANGICAAEGVTDVTLELLDVKGNPTGITYTARLIIGDSYGISIGDDVVVTEDDIGGGQKLTATPDTGVTLPEGYSVQWTTDDASIVAVDAEGNLTYVAYGNTDITARILDKDGNPTLYYAKINVQIGETPLRVLSIGNSFSRDSLNYISSLATLYDLRLEAAYLMQSAATIRMHAQNLAEQAPVYSWFTTNAATGEMKLRESDVTMAEKVMSEQWDIIILHEGVAEVGLPGNYNEDLRYLLDYLADVQPDADVYWNMTWALQDGFASGKHGADFSKFYKADQDIMYNAIVSNLDQFIIGEDAVFGADFDGWFPTGAALQNLRETIDHDLDLTRDGFHLSLDIGRLTAAMTLLKTIYPELNLSQITHDKVAEFIVTDKKDWNGFTEQALDTDESTYTYSAADLPKIIAAVEAACAIEGVPEKKAAAKTDTTSIADRYDNSVIMGQETLPMVMHFPDTKVTSDGTIWSCAYVGAAHYPNWGGRAEERLMHQGVGKIVIWTGTQEYTSEQWQASYEAPALVLTQELLEEWGCTQISGRYELLKENPAASYTVMADPRDGNFGVVTTDMDGDGVKEEVVLFTFWIRYYDQNGNSTIGNRLFMTWAIQDENDNWVWKNGCQELKPGGSAGGVKRGDVTSFSDGAILIPCYGRTMPVHEDAEYEASSAFNMYMEFDPDQGVWVEKYSYAMPNFDADESKTINEVSLVAPDPDSQTVYAMIREAGTVVVSHDRGKTWEYLANEPGLIHQPGFTVIDEERVFATWATITQPRPTYGKVFYVNADWNDTQSYQIYAPGTPHAEAKRDAADPSCALLPNGKVLVISYDTSYQAIVGIIEDPNDEKYELIELSENPDEVYVVYESDADTALSDTNAIPESVEVDGTYTIEAQVKIDSASGSAVIATSAGSVTVTGAAGDVINVIVKDTGVNNLVMTWAEGEEKPTKWEAVDEGTASEQPSVTGSGATLLDVTVSDRIRINLPDVTMTVGDPAVVLNYNIYPASDNVTFKSGDDSIVKIDAAGKMTPVSAGEATITVTVNGYAAKQCTVKILPPPEELSGEGATDVILWDDFEEDKYSIGEDAVWNYCSANSSTSPYIFKWTGATHTGKYNVVADGDNQYMVMTGATTWMASAAEITGNYTVSFDVMFSAASQSLNLTMWQNEIYEADGVTKTAGNTIHAFVNLQANASRYQYKALPLASTEANDDLYCNGDNTLVDSTVYDTTNGAVNIWQCVKMTRIDGGLYLKVWNKYEADGVTLAEEPAQWTCMLNHNVLDADIPSHFRMQFDCSKDTAQTCAIDNLKITQQVPFTPLADAKHNLNLGNDIDLGFFIPKDLVSGSDLTAVFVQDCIGAEDKTTVVASEDWVSWTVGGKLYWRINYTGIAAKEMTEAVQLAIMDGDKVLLTDVFSVQEQALKLIADTTGSIDTEEKTMMQKLLEYGAAAQLHFGYNTDNLAAEAPTAIATLTDNRPSAYKHNVTLTSEIDFSFFVPVSMVDRAGSTATITHALVDGGSKSIEAGQLVWEEDVFINGGIQYWRIRYKGVAAKEMTDLLTLTVTNAEGQEVVTDTFTVQSHAIKVINAASITDAEKVMMTAFLEYGAAAQIHFGYNTENLANQNPANS